ncbi:MAG: hypothetical protein ACKVY0_12730 [Prosthecobacter sp.]
MQSRVIIYVNAGSGKTTMVRSLGLARLRAIIVAHRGAKREYERRP